MRNPLENKRWRQIALALLIAGTVGVYALSPGSRLYWPFLLSSYLLGLFVYLRRIERADERRTIWGYLFPKEIWLHPSAINDYILVLVNFALFWLVFHYISSLGPGFFQDAVKNLLNHLPPSPTHTDSAPGWSVTVLYIAAAMLASEFFFYFDHRLQHTIPFLWEFHKVHHSAEVMTPLTVNRVHPAVFLLDVVSRGFGVGLVSAIFLFLYPNAKTVDIIAAATVGFGLINIAGGNLHHSHIALRFPRRIERIVTSPAIHQVHHSRKREHHDCNYGTVLTLWDWVFGSLYIPKDGEEVLFGVGDSEAYRSLSGLYILPVKCAAARLRRTLTNN